MSRPEFLSLIHTLKGCLKTRKVRYADLAKKTKLSEPTLKRLLGGNQCNIEHIFKICEAIEISFFDLASMAAADRIESYTLTEKQEEYFASDPDAYAVLCKLYDGKPLEEIRAASPLDKRSFQRVLLKLDQLGLAEVHTDDKVVFKIKKQMQWLENGPMVRKYYLQVGHEIVEESFLNRSADDVLFHVAAVDLSDENALNLKKDIENLIGTYIRQSARDKTFLPQERRRKVGWAFCMSPYKAKWLGGKE